MSAWSVVTGNYNHQNLLRNYSLRLTSNQLFSPQKWRKCSQVNFRVKIAAPICATPTPYNSIWGDHFLSYGSPDLLLAKDDMISHEQLKEKVRSMLMGCPNDSETLALIDAIQRLGVDYHYRTEIDQILANIMEKTKSCLNDEDDLHTAALKFRLLRQQRYNISCDVFNKFNDSNGEFLKDLTKDTMGMLSFYEASHFRTHGEDILDKAYCFTAAHLREIISILDAPLSNRVNNALKNQYHMGFPRVETWKYLQIYEGFPSYNKTLLSFAKLDFNLVQKLHQKELSELTGWWTELDFGTKLPFVRDRMVELYFFSMGLYFEPEFSLARMILAKNVALAVVIDDVFDDFAPYEELILFTAAFERWDLSAMKQLPEYMKEVYKATIDLHSEIEETMVKQGKSYRSYYARESIKLYIRGSLQQASWRHEKHMPTMDEYLRWVLPSIGWQPFFLVSLIGMGDVVTKHTLGWSISEPAIIIASALIGRYIDDIADFKVGHTVRNVFFSMDCYMNETNCTMEEALEELKERIIDLHKKINGEYMRLKSVPMPVMERLINFNKAIYFLYGDNYDLQTNSRGILKDYISALLEDPIPI